MRKGLRKEVLQQPEKKGKQSVFCVLFLLGVLISAIFLGSMRLYGIYLEQRLADCDKKIEAAAKIYASLEENYASLLSPSRVYTYAMSELKMVAGGEIETIKLPSGRYGGGKGGSAAKASAGAPGGLSRVLVGTANAKE